MDKEQALIILKELHKDAFYSVRTALETLIPEIKEESDDERIRKELIEHCKNQLEPYIYTGCECPQIQSWITWLEKQGKRDKFKDAIQIGDKVTRNRDGVLVNLSQLERVAKKENLCNKCRKEQPSHSCADITELGRCVIEHEAKIEPKFKIRNWIVNNNSGYIYQVTDIRDDEYCLWPIDTEIEGYVKIIDVDNDYHLWTIESAKDGDIIYIKRYKTNDEWLLIFKKIKIQNGFIDVYDYYAFCITSDNIYHESVGGGCWGGLLANNNNNNDIVCPATKEQRDLLFSKIRNTGYEWNEKEKVIVKVQEE